MGGGGGGGVRGAASVGRCSTIVSRGPEAQPTPANTISR